MATIKVREKAAKRNKPLIQKEEKKKVKKKHVIDVDSAIIARAKSGALAQAGKKAFKRSLENGLSVMVAEDGAIYKIHPNGTRTRIKAKSMFYRNVKTGKLYQK